MDKSKDDLEFEVERLTVFSELSSDWFWEQDADFRFNQFSGQNLKRLYGIDNELMGNRRWELDIVAVPPSDIDEHIRCCKKHEKFTDFQYQIRDENNEIQYVSVSGVPYFNNQGEFAGYRGVGSNITQLYEAQLALEKAKKYCKQIVDRSPIASFSIDENHNVTHWNRSCELLSGLSESDMIGTTAWRGFYSKPRPVLADLILDNVFENTLKDHYGKNVRRSSVASGAYEVEDYFPNLLGGCWLLFTAVALYDDQGKVIGAVEILQDISCQKEQEKKILHQANFDYLTGLPNRFLSLDRLKLLLEEAERSKNKVAVFFLDLDEFKKVNDNLGHVVGDELLVKCADRLKSIMRRSDILGRLGGDEFVILVKDFKTISDVQVLATKILKSFRKVFYLGERSLMLTASIGISVYPEDGNSPTDLLRNADVAMYHSKKEGRNFSNFFSPEMNLGSSRRLLIEEQLHGVIGRDELTLNFQPVVNLDNNEIIGAEALLRWNHPELGMISPEEFIPIAEQTGLIIPIGYFVLSEALRVNSELCQLKKGSFNMAVNISPIQFRDEKIISKIKSALENHNIPSNDFTIEVTEGVMMKEKSKICSYLDELADYGIGLSMDDFGTGYSSLSYLRNYPFKTLKIDRSFISGLKYDSSAPALIDATIAMAKALCLEVIAEGIETDYQNNYLLERGCDYGQGYFYSRPISESDFKKLLIESH